MTFSRAAAIAAAERAMFMSHTGRAWDEDVSVLGRPTSIARHNAHRDAVVAIDAAAPHLQATPTRYVVVEGTLDEGTFDSPEAAREWIAARGLVGCRVVGLVLIEDPK